MRKGGRFIYRRTWARARLQASRLKNRDLVIREAGRGEFTDALRAVRKLC